MGRERVRPRLRRLRPVRRPGRGPARPAADVRRLARGLRRLLRSRRDRRRGLDAARRPVRHRRRRRLHDAGRAVDHHHPLRRGPAPQPCPARVRRDRGRRVLARHDGRRVADRAALALGLLRTGAAGRTDPGGGDPAAAGRVAAGPCRRRLRPGRYPHADRVDAAAGVRRGDLAGRADGPDGAGAGREPGAAGRLRGDRAAVGGAADPVRHPPVGTAGPGQSRRDAAGRFVRRLPVRRCALPAGAPWLVRGRDRPGADGDRTGRDPGADPDAEAGRTVRQRAGDLRRCGAGRRRARVVPDGRPRRRLRGDAARLRGARDRVRAGLRTAHDRRDRRRTRGRAGPRGRHPDHVVPVRCRARAGGRRRGAGGRRWLAGRPVPDCPRGAGRRGGAGRAGGRSGPAQPRAAMKAAIACSTSSVECAADSWVRIRALPCGTTG